MINSKFKQEGIGSACGKVILIGEHSVVYGYPAIGIPVSDLKITTTVYPNNFNKIILDDYIFQGEINFSLANKSPLICAIQETIEYLQISSESFTVSINSSLKKHRGLGSSAAICISTIKALFDYTNNPLPDDVLFKLVDKAETIAHYNPSGIDAYICSKNSSVVFSKNNTPDQIELNLNGYLVIADTNIAGKTKDAVLLVKNNYHKQEIQDALKNLGSLTKLSISAIQDKNLNALGKYMTYAHHSLQQVQVSCSELDTLVNIALQYGALGAKLTGGGLGGNMIALFDTKEQADHIINEYNSIGIKNTWLQTI